MNTLTSIWEKLLIELEDMFVSNVFESFIKPAQPISFFNQELTIAVSPTIKKQWEQYIKNAAISVLSPTYPKITVNLQEEFPNINNTHTIEATPVFQNKLNPAYTFDNFIVGEGNRMSHAAALASVENTIFNPLFIYGGSGLGKTHLMHAVGNSLLKINPQANIKYLSSDRFVNDFTKAIREKKIDDFKNSFQEIDLLLVDDIQFLSGKEQTLNEFFAIFNNLYDQKKQIILTSDRNVKDIPDLPDRLVSRFGQGLITEITPLDLETRTAILREKANRQQINISDDTLNYIAAHINSNVRELEGALTTVNFYAITNRCAITTSLAAEALKSQIGANTEKILSIDDIQTEVSRVFNVSIDELKGKKRVKEIVIPRQIAMYLCRELTDQSLPTIGREFGNRDHTTVMHAEVKIANLLAENSDTHLIKQIEFIKTNLK